MFFLIFNDVYCIVVSLCCLTLLTYVVKPIRGRWGKIVNTNPDEGEATITSLWTRVKQELCRFSTSFVAIQPSLMQEPSFQLWNTYCTLSHLSLCVFQTGEKFNCSTDEDCHMHYGSVLANGESTVTPLSSLLFRHSGTTNLSFALLCFWLSLKSDWVWNILAAHSPTLSVSHTRHNNRRLPQGL